jgi:hypothetical protein
MSENMKDMTVLVAGTLLGMLVGVVAGEAIKRAAAERETDRRLNKNFAAFCGLDKLDEPVR